MFKEHQRLLKKQSTQDVLLFPRDIRESPRQDTRPVSQRPTEQDGEVHTHDSPQEGADQKAVEGHAALTVHRKSKSVSEPLGNIFMIRRCCWNW